MAKKVKEPKGMFPLSITVGKLAFKPVPTGEPFQELPIWDCVLPNRVSLRLVGFGHTGKPAYRIHADLHNGIVDLRVNTSVEEHDTPEEAVAYAIEQYNKAIAKIAKLGGI